MTETRSCTSQITGDGGGSGKGKLIKTVAFRDEEPAPESDGTERWRSGGEAPQRVSQVR